MNVVSALRISRPVTAARISAATILFAIAVGTAGPTFGQSPATDPVVAIVNGIRIQESDVETADEIVGRNLMTQDKVERRETILKMFIDTILLAQVAKDRKLVDEADLQRRINFARNQGLMTHLLAVVGQQAVTEDSIRNAYEQVVVKAASNEQEFHLRQLFLMVKEPKDGAAVREAEEKAKAALKRIKGGEDFAAVAADVSDDPVTKARGGDFGWRIESELGKEYVDAILTLKNGEVSPLIKTAVGWHIIKIEDRRPRKPIALEKLRDRIAAMVAANAQFELVDKLRAEAKIERLDVPDAAKEPAKAN
jgi:peptidylprolyl isomerase/peptidyl-prolyl cis-trans isomerase C